MDNSEIKSGRPKRKTSPFTNIFCELITGLTQQQAAEKIGVARQNIGRWTSGETTPDIETLVKIAEAFNVSTDYLLGRTEVKTAKTELKAICDYTGLTEKAVENIRSINNDDGNINLLLEYSSLNTATKLLEDIQYIASYKRYFNERIFPIVYNKEFYNALPFSEQSSKSQNHNPKTYIFDLLGKHFLDCVERQLGQVLLGIPENDVLYNEQQDLVEYRLIKSFGKLIDDIENDCSIDKSVFDIFDNRIREDLQDYLDSILYNLKNSDDYLDYYSNASDVARFKRYISLLEDEADTLKTFLTLYDEHFNKKDGDPNG